MAMLDFLSKFIFRRPTSATTPTPAANQIAAAQMAESKKNQAERARAVMLEKIAASANDETALIALLLSCDFADGRLSAAQQVHSPAGLEQVRAAMLNTDKRVAKLMQTRLDAIAQRSQQESLARLCIEEAQHLAQQSHLLPQQIIDLEKRGALIAGFPDELKPQFDQICQQITEKMLAQTALQRRVLDIQNQLSSISAISAGEQSESDVALDLSRLQHLQEELYRCQNQPEISSLPKNLLSDCFSQLQQQQQRQAQRLHRLEQEQKKAAQRTLSGSVMAEVAAETVTETVAETVAEAAAQAESTAEPATELAVEAAETTEPAKKSRTEKPAAIMSSSQILAAIQGLEQALQEGSIQNARKFDRELRTVDARAAGLTAEQKERMFQARSELGHLQGWAKWGGDVSRDELINAVNGLIPLSLAPNELAKKVATMRERWREMEANSGSASKELWERFDAACKTAYEPAALFFQQQDELRKTNLLTAENLLAELRSKAEELLHATPDWKAMANFCMQAQQNWKQLGQVDRKHRARLDKAFEASLQPLRQPLEQRRQEEILSREALIAEVMALDPQQRSATEQLRALQERWQAQASSVPLRRKDEQALWEKFRAACDALFAQRKLASGEADAQRKENLTIKAGLCAALEQAVTAPDVNLPQLLQQTANSWKNTAAVPRADEAAIEQRYQAAVLALRQRMQALQDQKSQASKANYLKKLSACLRLESMLMDATTLDDRPQQMERVNHDWAQTGSVPAKLNHALQLRFDAACAALQKDDQAYRALLQKNSVAFDAALLRLEILSGIDSPADLSRERLQMQVDVLQNSLKRGAEPHANNAGLHQLLSMPAALDAARLQRLEKVLAANELPV